MKILVAEDEPEIVRLYKILLESCGHEVITTKDGEECMDVYKAGLDDRGNSSFDLLILDYRMPKKTGLEVANEVLAICSSQKLLMATAYAGQLEAVDNLKKMQVIRKPFEIDQLIAAVNKLASL